MRGFWQIGKFQKELQNEWIKNVNVRREVQGGAVCPFS